MLDALFLILDFFSYFSKRKRQKRNIEILEQYFWFAQIKENKEQYKKIQRSVNKLLRDYNLEKVRHLDDFDEVIDEIRIEIENIIEERRTG
ncbi:MAG: hypothetical protein ACRCWQ_09235 [Bacilli bacterium]